MALVIPPGFMACAISLDHANDPEPWSVTWGQAVSLAVQDAEDWANDALAHFTAAWFDSMDSQVTIGPVTCTFGNDGPDPIVIDSTTTPITGTRAIDSIAQNSAVLVRKRTALGGRKNRGRVYMPGLLPRVDVGEMGNITPGLVSDLQIAAGEWLSNIETGQGGLTATSEMVILHSESAVTAGLPAPTVVTSLQVDSTIATQRRRLRR